MEIPSIEQMQDFLKNGFVNISKEKSYFSNLQEIKQYYQKNYDKIIKHHSDGRNTMYRANPCDWTTIFSPIEFDAWQSIRCKGNIPLYPQFPVGKYYIDFGNPFYKVGLELDGKNYHDQNKDFNRDIELHQLGWKIIRINGFEMVKTDYHTWGGDYEDWSNEDLFLDELRYWFLNTGDGIIEAMKVYFFGGNLLVPEQFIGQTNDIIFRSLITHNLIKCEL